MKSKARRIGYYYTVGSRKHMMLLGTYSKSRAVELKARKKRQGFTVATRVVPTGVELYIRQD